MLLRFVAENFLSFKEATELNTFTSSKSKSLMHHRVICDHAEVLRLNAIYGANGAGKSNFVKALNFLQLWLITASLEKAPIPSPFTFKLDKGNQDAHSAFAVEFSLKGKIYYYQIEFDHIQIYREELLRSGKNRDYAIYTREGNDIKWLADDKSGKMNAQLLDVVSRMLRKDMPLLSFMGMYYPELSIDVSDAYRWFTRELHTIEPTTFPEMLPHMLDIFPDFAKLSQQFICATNNGITALNVKKEEMDDDASHYASPMKEGVEFAKQHPHVPYTFLSPLNRNLVNIVYEDGRMLKKTMTITHLSKEGDEVEFDYVEESDGTRRLIEYLPLLYGLTKESVYVVDEIERSIHPVLMKKMLEIISMNENIRGQLIFTTHELNLLDQSLLRPDEIWFAQKNVEQATEFYPLSDYRIHHTANIQNGYLDGRYGGIPLVSKLNELKGEGL